MCSPLKGFLLIHTAEIVSVVWCTTWRLSLQCDAQRRDCLCGVIHNVEIVSAVWCTTRILSLQCAEIVSAVGCIPGDFFRNLVSLSPRKIAHRGDCLRSVMHTAKIVSAVCITLLRLTPWWDAHCRDCVQIIKNGGSKPRGTLPLRWYSIPTP